MTDLESPPAASVADDRSRAQVAEAEARHAELLKQKEEADRALTLVQTEKQALARKLKDLDADLAARTAREADLVRERAASKTKLSGRIASLEMEKAALVQKLTAVESDRDSAVSEAALLLKQKTEAEHALTLVQTEKQALARKLKDLDADLAARTAREADLVRERAASKSKLSGRIASLEMEKAEAARREETQLHAIAEQRARAERLEAEAAAHKEFEARLTDDGARLRAGLVERISRLEAEAALALRTFGELLAKIAEGERALDQARGEAKEISATLADAERSHAQALAEALRAQDELRVSLAEAIAQTEAAAASAESARAEQLEKDLEEGARLRADFLEQISRLEAEAALAQEALAELSTKRTEGVRALAQARGEAKETSEKLTEVERGHAQALAEALRAEEALRVSLAEQIARTEAAAASAESARGELVAQREEGDRALESARTESEALLAKIAGMETDHAMALAEAARSEDTLRQALDAERQRAEQFEKDIEAFFEGEAKLIREWETSRAEWSEKIRLLEDAATESGTAQADLLARRMEAEEALASLRAERETLVTRLTEIEGERDRAQAAVALREATPRADLEGPGTPAEVWEAARTELLARIARLEANEVLTEKARTELVGRKRDSDRALAAAQAERAALLKKLAIAESGRDHD